VRRSRSRRELGLDLRVDEVVVVVHLTFRLNSSTATSESPASSASATAAETVCGAILSISSAAVRSVSTNPTCTPSTCVSWPFSSTRDALL
jgi:hypothetical protein